MMRKVRNHSNQAIDAIELADILSMLPRAVQLNLQMPYLQNVTHFIQAVYFSNLSIPRALLQLKTHTHRSLLRSSSLNALLGFTDTFLSNPADREFWLSNARLPILRLLTYITDKRIVRRSRSYRNQILI